jgi:hypothetical protein
MATRIETILLRARDTLADPNGERWSTDRLLRLLDEGQKDVAKHTKLLKGQTTIPLVEGQAIYELPSDVWLITRAAFDDCRISLYTYDQLDELVRTRALDNNYDRYNERGNSYNSSEPGFGGYCWETDTGAEVQALVYDRRNLNEIRVYPIPNEDISTNSYTFETDDPEFEGAELLGVTADITDYSFDTVFGVVTELYDPQVEIENFQEIYGVLTGINESEGVINIWYIKMPTEITTVDDTLETPAMFDTALKHYLVANAFDDDYDTRFAEKSAKALVYYERELGIAQDTQANDGVRDSQVNTTDYRGAFS